MKAIFLFIAISLLPTTAIGQDQTGVGHSNGTEIVATGDSWIRVLPDRVVIDIVLDESGTSASESDKTLEKRRTKLESAARAVADDAKVFVRSSEYSSGTGRAGAVTPQSPVRIVRYLGVETGRPERTSQLIDALLSNGASSLVTTTFMVRDREAAIAQGAADAAKKARAQAEAVARTLGVVLGPLVATAVAADDEASLLIREKQEGVPPADFRDQEIKVTASVRYEIARNLNAADR
ncbi:MAG: SIMPL domain-containing protein [Deltaproteobacteria bacterium]|nr:SIMPL domain-containing protein [Deltaproteobacteria bacterium]